MVADRSWAIYIGTSNELSESRLNLEGTHIRRDVAIGTGLPWWPEDQPPSSGDPVIDTLASVLTEIGDQ